MYRYRLHNYTFRANYSPEKDSYIGTCDQFPSLSHVDKDIRSTIKGITDLVLDVLKDLEKDNDDEHQTTDHT